MIRGSEISRVSFPEIYWIINPFKQYHNNRSVRRKRRRKM